MKKNHIFRDDYYRNTAGQKYSFFKYFKMGKKLKMLYWFRKCQTSKGLAQKYNRWRYNHYRGWNNNDFSWRCKIGKGLYLGHTGGRYINEAVIIGDNCNINHNVTIGQTNRGENKGVPTIGNEVWIGCNSVIVANIKIGNNVLIAPNTYVNFDVPDNSLVIGNPAVIKSKEDATEGYINFKV